MSPLNSMALYSVILSSIINQCQSQIISLELQTSSMPIDGTSWATYYQSTHNKIWLLSPRRWNQVLLMHSDPYIISYDIDADTFETHPNISNRTQSMNGWTPRYSVAIGDDVYFNGDTANIHVYNINDDTATYIHTISWRQSCLATDGRFIFFMGGERLDSVMGDLSTAAYDTNTGIWYEGNYQQYWLRRFPCELINGVIYTFGGNDGKSQDYICKLNVGTVNVMNNYRNNYWQNAGNLIISRAEHNTVKCDSADDSLVYILGGTHDSGGGAYEVLDIEIYDIDTETTELATFALDKARVMPAVMCVAQDIYIFGGALYPEHHSWEKAKVATESPTVSPTKKPTLNPTAKTKEPTNNPTLNPTNIPTIAPSSKTEEPTINPTFIPTNIPSLSPTKFPTLYPTNMPSLTPTENPTLYPTNIPSLTPTKYPTNMPSLSPTKYPTNIPSSSPSSDPTKRPSLSPTEHPSILPINIVIHPPSTEYIIFPSYSSTVSVRTNDVNDAIKEPKKQVDVLMIVFCIIIVVTSIAIVVFLYRLLKLRKQVSMNRNHMKKGQKSSVSIKQREETNNAVCAKSQEDKRPQRKRTLSLSLSSSSSSDLYDTNLNVQTAGAKVEKELECHAVETAGEGLEGCRKDMDNNSNITAVTATVDGSHDDLPFEDIINVTNTHK